MTTDKHRSPYWTYWLVLGAMGADGISEKRVRAMPVKRRSFYKFALFSATKALAPGASDFEIQKMMMMGKTPRACELDGNPSYDEPPTMKPLKGWNISSAEYATLLEMRVRLSLKSGRGEHTVGSWGSPEFVRAEREFWKE